MRLSHLVTNKHQNLARLGQIKNYEFQGVASIRLDESVKKHWFLLIPDLVN